MLLRLTGLLVVHLYVCLLIVDLYVCLLIVHLYVCLFDRAQDGSPSQRSGRSKRSTRQLDFFQAMSDFRSMFPTLDDEVIEAVLRANDGAVDATIDQLLTMTIDEDTSAVRNIDGLRRSAVIIRNLYWCI